MRNVQELDKGLLNSEFELAKMLHDLLRTQGYSSLKTAAMIYRHGVLDGKQSQRAPLDAAYKELRALRASMQPSQPEATIEGSTTNE